MSPTNPVFALLAFLAALGTAWLLTRMTARPLARHRYTSIDGLRGCLAFSVFLHHAVIWYFYLRVHRWEVPPSNFYTELGQASVALFFMITGFLFFSKILAASASPIDWTRLYVSRVCRLAPLYYFMLAILVTITFALAGFRRNEGIVPLAVHIIDWASFLLQTPINGINETGVIIAGVTWTLPYEWMFYLSLPVMAVILRRRTPWPVILGSICLLAIMLQFWLPARVALGTFGGGVIAAFCVRSPRFCRFAVGRLASILAIGCLVLVLFAYPAAFQPMPLAVLAVAFTLIAGGNTLFGMLVSTAFVFLGEISYSVYLLQGFALFGVLRGVIGADRAAALSPGGHWLAVIASTPVFIALCFATYSWIEAPAMRRVDAATTAYRSIWRTQLNRRFLGFHAGKLDAADRP